MEKEFQENERLSNSSYNFYTNRSLKVKDLMIGFFSGFGYIILAFLLVFISYDISESFGVIITVAVVIFYLLAILFFFYKRFYLSIGLILLVTVPPAIIGGCLALILK